MSRRVTFWGSALLAGTGLVFATTRAVRIAWPADDSFVSFRYAWNLVRGHGLVYSAGERVEGYSNLLWTLLMAGGMSLGVTPEVASKALGILCWLLRAGPRRDLLPETSRRGGGSDSARLPPSQSGGLLHGPGPVAARPVFSCA